MLAVGGRFKALSAVAFFFAWKFYKLPRAIQAEAVGRQDSSPSDVAPQITIVDGNGIPKEKMDTELVLVSQFITVSDLPKEKLQTGNDNTRITNI